MPLTFEQPLWLLLILLVIPVAASGVSWFAAMSRARALSAVVLRSVLIALIAGILAGASAVHTSDRLAVIAVVDVSDSVTEFADLARDDAGGRIPPTAVMRAWLQAAAADPRRGPDDLLGVVAFDSGAIALATPQPAGAEPLKGLSFDHRSAEGTNIEQALRFAAALFPPDAARRIVLISDANQTEGDALAAARSLSTPSAAAAGAGGGGGRTPIDVLPLAYKVAHEVMIAGVDAPPQAAAESAITVRVLLTSTDQTHGTLELLYEGEPLDLNGASVPGTGRPITLHPGTNIEQVQVRLAKGTVHRLRPVFIPADTASDRIASNNAAETFTVTPGKGSVLVVDGVGRAKDGPGLTLPHTLAEAGINVQTIPPEQLPSDLFALQAYDLIILQNVAAEDLPRHTHQLLADYVTELGGGLVMVGGPDSFGAGGWKGTALEPILPVNLDLPEQLLVPSAAVVFVLDNSGSMSRAVLGGSRSQQEIADEGAALAIMTLDPTDLVGVIAFNSDHRVVVPFARNSDAAASAARVRSISPGGGTNLYPALAQAARQLTGVEAAVRHVIVLTDGRSQGEPSEGFELARRMHNDGITVSTIAVGDDADLETLSRIAGDGGGQFYNVTDPNTLPRVFIREIRVVRKPLIRESPFIPVDLRSGSPLVSGLTPPFPALRGLVLTQRRPDPKITNSLATPEAEPILADWFVGRGRVAAFTSDASRWARDWLAWPGYAALWTQIARTVARPAAERSAELTAEIVGNELRVRLDAADEQGRPLDLLSVNGTLYAPNAVRSEIKLSQTGPGAYEARFPAPARGNYFVALTPQQGEKRLPPVIGGASRPLGVEFRALQSNIGLLRRIAESTGGRILDLQHPERAELFARQGARPVRAASPIWRVLLLWSIAVFLLDVATRRVAWDRLLTRELALELKEQAAGAVRARSEQAAATLAALRGAAQRPTSATTINAHAEPTGGADAQCRGPDIPLAERLAREPARDVYIPPELTDVEQQAAAAALEERRQRLRAQMLQRLNNPARSDQPPTPKPATPPDAPPPEPPISSLLAAKRRAQARFDNDQKES